MTLPTMIDDERPVEEVYCAETGVPLTAIPNWYASVNVRFVSNAAKKQAAGYGNASTDDGIVGRPPGDGEVDGEAALEEIELDEIEIDELETEAEEE